ncbi:hypothetical protein N7462_005919 [Penicillium macrosclerotiorum]|uniref:uncharacterized protein n=1 Tax=Penicillium macrosclerotiorum TaxID=303699 RepID=UPI002548F86F|nr:uncharacterized protein N7462_005919 [Penicillium macrosclerotiorum]KAJ5682754.1 hypothetical protein N7462_005919 [Penicillium macrosclerotiorum]
MACDTGGLLFRESVSRVLLLATTILGFQLKRERVRKRERALLSENPRQLSQAGLSNLPEQ